VIIARAAALSQSFANPYAAQNRMAGIRTEAAMNSSGGAPKRRLGQNGPEVTAIGLGCMSLSGTYGPSDDKAATENLVERLMGKKPELRFQFIQENAVFAVKDMDV